MRSCRFPATLIGATSLSPLFSSLLCDDDVDENENDDDDDDSNDDDDDSDDDDDDSNDDDGASDDLYIIGAVCLSVTKMLTFRIQGIWSFLMFIDTFPFSKVSGNRRNDQIH